MNNTTTKILKIDVPTVFICKWATATEIIEFMDHVELDKVVETDEIDPEAVVLAELDKVVEVDEVNVETEPFVFKFIQLWKAATRVYTPEYAGSAQPSP